MTTPENAADTTGGASPIPAPIIDALNQLRRDADRAHLRATRSPYAMGARDALDKAIRDLTTALRATYSPETEDNQHDPQPAT